MPKVKVRNNNVDAALRVFKKKCSETLWDYKQKEYYVPRSEKRRLAKQAAVARFKRKRKTMIDGTNFELVGDFMQAFGQSVETQPTWPDFNTRELRVDLIQEEVDELGRRLQTKIWWKSPTLSQTYSMWCTVLVIHLVLTLMSVLLKYMLLT